MNNEIIKIAGIEFTSEEMKKVEKEYFENNKKYIIRFKTIYELVYNEPRFDKLNKGYFGAREVYKLSKNDKIGFTKKGRYIIGDAKRVNELIGNKVFVED